MSKRRQLRRAVPTWDCAPAERWNGHGQDDAVSATGVQSVFRAQDELRRDGFIGDDELCAADRFADVYARGVAGHLGTPGRGGIPAGRIVALGHYREAVTALGPHSPWVEATICRDFSLRYLIEKLSRPPTEVRDSVIAALRALAAHYRNVDRQRAAAKRAAAERQREMATA